MPLHEKNTEMSDIPNQPSIFNSINDINRRSPTKSPKKVQRNSPKKLKRRCFIDDDVFESNPTKMPKYDEEETIINTVSSDDDDFIQDGCKFSFQIEVL